ncbi:outer membrane beta-barrel protein [Hansschlegelia sp.]|uniref:outer membrane beta-barrel protein n=1 Tax=Hansschlegelia sp. TaxID=2041892 RepID=UPI002D1CE12E|nr:outer membrane beta-barrel protein [Hansschlegelia sp.]HVI27819.1 outer membrane beta-barrel protein [Hansschlegelia sp.]
MSRRRAICVGLLIGGALVACGGARAQQAQTGAAQATNAPGEEPLRRLDPATLAGGDYGGTEPVPLAGGDYGRQTPTEPDTAAPGPTLIGDPLASPPGGARPRRPQPPGFEADDAYAPTAVRAGAFILRPSLETAGGYDSNPLRDPAGGKSSPFYRLRGAIEAQSDWDRHEVDVRLDGQIRRYTDLPSPGYEPNLSAIIDGRLDVSDRTQINSELRASLTTPRRGDPDTPTNIKGDEVDKSIGATLGVSHAFNRLSFKVEGLADRYLFNDAKLQNGGTLDNSDRIYNAYELRLRGAYELSPGLQPFAEVAVDTRDYDKTFGDDGRRLGSSGYAIRGGARFEATRLITGEAAIGYGRQTPKDKGLKPVDGLILDGTVAWAATGLTTVRLDAKTSFQETTLPGAGGVLGRSAGIAVEHRLRRNLILTARADFERSSYRGIGRVDDGLTLALEGEYRLNRTLSMIGSFQHERLNSNLAGEDYRASIVEFGMRMRR